MSFKKTLATVENHKYDFFITVQELDSIVGKRDVVIFDCSWYLPGKDKVEKRAIDEFMNERITTSLFFDIDIVASNSHLPHMIPSKDAFLLFLNLFAIEKESEIILYDQHGAWSSFRVFWMFKVFGYEHVKILEGGFAGWKSMNCTVEEGSFDFYRMIERRFLKNSSLIKQYFQSSLLNLCFFTSDNEVSFKHCWISQLHELEHFLERGDCYLIDLRSVERFNGVPGTEPRIGMPSGHIEGSINIPYDLFVNSDKSSLKSPSEIFSLLSSRLESDWLISGKRVIFMCGTGIAACVGFASLMNILEKLHLPLSRVSVYDGSWFEYVYLKNIRC